MATPSEPDEQNDEQNGEDQNGEKKQARHSSFIGTLLVKTAKIQREMRGRPSRYKDVSVALKEAVDSLKTFQTEEWPRELAKMPPPPEWMDPEPGSPLVQDDPISRHVMPDAVTNILNAYIMVLMHPYKTNRAIDMTLECITTLIAERYVSGRAGLNVENRMSSSLDGDEPAPAPPSLLHGLIEAITECADINVETIQTGVVKAVSAIMTSPKCGIHEACMLKPIRATFHVYLVTKSPNCKSISKSSLLEMIRSVFSFMETYDVMSKSQADASLDAFAAQYTADAYLLFRALCKLSSKNIDESKASMLTNFVSSGGPVDPMAVQSKTLSLELLLALLDDAGEAFCTSEKFIYAVQNYLCVSLLKNCTSGDTQVAYLSQKIFLVLVYKFKAQLKSEIEVFMSNIFLRVLESPNSSFQQKALVLESLRTLCSDPVLLTQIFLNYDCDLDALSLYKEIVHNLTKLSGKSSTGTSSSSLTKKEAEHEFELCLAGSEVLVTILQAFLKALDLPGGEDVTGEDSASARLRDILKLDVGLPTKTFESEPKKAPETEESSSVSSNEGQEQAPSSSDVAGKIVGTFEMKRTAQQNFELGRVKFTLSHKSGIQYFVENGFVELDARAIAHFFLEHKEKLDKTEMGEAVGRDPESSYLKEKGVDPEKGGHGFWVRVLHHYVDAMDFTGMEFDDAIRFFLSGFRLPGEAQKIDRIMEKFAEHYTRQNLDVFPSADTAFILAFSIIMLNTDLHNPSIKPEKRMTVESFIRNNRGISVDGTDLPEEFLAGIFKRIQAQAFSLKEDDDARERFDTKGVFQSSYFFEGGSFFGTSAEERKRENFRKEREEMTAATEQLFKKRPGMTQAEKASKAASMQLTDSVAPAEVIKPMYDVTWGPMIGTLSQVLECSTDERSIAVCLNGFAYAIRIAAHSHMSLARDTFINSLAKFTFLGSIKEMKHKNIESIKTLMSIAIFDGEHLCESWGPVLQCISQLARLRLLSSGLDTDESFIAEKEKVQSQLEKDLVAGPSFFRQPTKAEITRETEESNGRAVLTAVNEVLIDKVFLSTVKLSALGIAHFIEQLVAVSASEVTGHSKRGITGVGTTSSRLVVADANQKSQKESNHDEDGGPRIFSLQRLVEVADYNMDVRPRLAWAQMWEYMADHFAKIGCHQNSFVSVFAIDSLKQLSFKFLEKPELSEFNFQRIFLRPFLQIMENKDTREDNRELILRCIDNMVRSISHNLRSGWKVIFSILAISADDASERINTLGLAILQRLLDEHLHQLCRLTDGDGEEGLEDEIGSNVEMSALERRNRNANVEDFVGLCRASLAFVQTNHSVTPLPIGLSMRALCHTACYADLLADHRVLPPVSGTQSIDPHAPGYTYDGLCEKEALEMVLWRSLLDGLAEGVRSLLPSHAGGMGCLVQRGSVLALRAILLRHGHTFSTTQWAVILKQTLLPCIQEAAENDETPVIRITSESPSISSLEFVVESQPLPPAHENEGLRKFAELSESLESALRPLGKAELLVEASFADLRHRADGDLSRAYELVQKNRKAGFSEQPFPDSWIATTSGTALGMITDIASEICLYRGEEARKTIWPLVFTQYKLWVVGRSGRKLGDGGTVEEVANGDSQDSTQPWQPCEALIRASCRELHRFPQRLFDAESTLGREEVALWSSLFSEGVADILSRIIMIESGVHEEMLQLKLEAFGIPSEEEPPDDDGEVETDSDGGLDAVVSTPYGEGRLIEKRTDTYSIGDGGNVTVAMNVIRLDFGATLYRPAPDAPDALESPASVKAKDGDVAKDERQIARESIWKKFIPALKVQCVAAYCLQHSLFSQLESLVPILGRDEISSLLDALDQSRTLACRASLDEELSLAFQAAMFSQWGDGVEEVEEVLNTGRLSNQSESATFFLTQESGATNNVIHVLSLLYQSKGASDDFSDSDRERFAEPLLLERMVDVLNKFLESERQDGHLIDPNLWRNASKGGDKIAIYCTSFAVVVVSILDIMLSITPEQFSRHKQHFFPLLCSLVRVQSDEIRQLVSLVLLQQISPLLGVTLNNVGPLL